MVFFRLASLSLCSEDTVGGDSGHRVKGSEPPTHPGPGRGVTDQSPIVFLARNHWEFPYLCSRGVGGGVCLGEAVPTLLFSLSAFQLILTIVGTIAGVLILGMLTALIVSMRYMGQSVPFLGHSTVSTTLWFPNTPSLSQATEGK